MPINHLQKWRPARQQGMTESQISMCQIAVLGDIRLYGKKDKK